MCVDETMMKWMDATLAGEKPDRWRAGAGAASLPSWRACADPCGNSRICAAASGCDDGDLDSL
jgi:hypothetical protein